MPEWFADNSLWAATALDLACGPGRHEIALASRGFAVTAVDRSALHLAKARQNVASAHVAIELVQADMRAFVRPDSFHLALSLFTSFGSASS